MFCMNCGKELPSGAKFCDGCGTKVGEVSNTSSSQKENTIFEVGKFVKFGNYDWVVLDVCDGKALIFSKDVIMQNSWYDGLTQLNEEFINKNFTDKEMGDILCESPYTVDDKKFKLFYLTKKQCRQYESIIESFKANTCDVEAGWSWLYDADPNGWGYKMNINCSGYISESGHRPSEDYWGVRPAMWVKI